MRTNHFQGLLRKIPQLSKSQLDTLLKTSTERRSALTSCEVLDEIRGEHRCQHCDSSQVVKNGHSRGLQRYRCKDCQRTSNSATGTALQGLHHKELLDRYARCMVTGMTIRMAARQCGVAVSTSFRWRHRFLKAAVDHQPHGVSGLVELDETYFLHSQKGERKLARPARHRGGRAKKRGLSKEQVPVLTAITRGQRFIADKVLTHGMNRQAVEAVLRSLLRPQEAIVCADKHVVYQQINRSSDIDFQLFTAADHGSRDNRAIHVQTVNSYHSTLKRWINGNMRGVATKYLPNYLAWQRIRSWFKDAVTPQDFIAEAMGKQLINT